MVSDCDNTFKISRSIKKQTEEIGDHFSDKMKSICKQLEPHLPIFTLFNPDYTKWMYW